MVLLFLLPLFFCKAQTNSVVQLSYNIKVSFNSVNKIEDKNGNIGFQIDNEYFQYQEGKDEINKIESAFLEDIEIIDIGTLLRLFQQKKRELLEKDGKTGVIHFFNKRSGFRQNLSV